MRFCDGMRRRNFLTIGALAPMGLTLPDLYRAEAASRTGRSNRSVIMVYLTGGMAHQDTFDLKPSAPAEVRGEFKPIATRVPGVQICEHLPRLASCADQWTVIRSLVGQIDEHSSFQSTSGFPMSVTKREGKPHFGSVVAKSLGSLDPSIPPFVDLFPTMQHKPYNSPPSSMLGRSFAGVRLDGDSVGVMKLGDFPQARFTGRKDLLTLLDRFKKETESIDVAGMDQNYQRAFEVLTSSKLLQAIDLDKESDKTRDRYGRGSSRHQGDGAPQWNDQLLMARRLVEAGARCVTVAYGFWDTHGNNFKALKGQLPLFDQGISALIEDLRQRGLDQSTTVCVWGEFGRTPKINKDVGRDHWSRVNFALLAGGGMRTGQVIGSTDSSAGSAKDMPVHYLDVLASIYHNLGIDPHAMVNDLGGRPAPILPSTAHPVSRLYS
ncbi:MAG: DUF1501 domain-containing protein [Gemmataceae bacterium]|nr:DUF1501 domain-containing protein [Gemmataceae bacterium]